LNYSRLRLPISCLIDESAHRAC